MQNPRTTSSPSLPTGETTLPEACLVCGSDVELKVKDGKATSYCRTCHFIGHPDVRLTFEGLKVGFKPAGSA